MTTSAPPPTPSLFAARQGAVTLVDVPELRFAAVDGRGAPGGAGFHEAVQGLYTVAYGVRFALRERGVEEKVSALEALWWMPDPQTAFTAALAAGGFSEAGKAAWSWQALIRLPPAAGSDLVAAVKRQAVRRHPELAPALDRVLTVTWREGLCAQTLHVGPYSTELATVRLLHDAIAARGYRPAGRHHEIYLNDPRRCAPERIRTILRQPVEPIG